MVSLSGIIVIMARGLARMRRAQFTQSIQSVRQSSLRTETNEVLRPAQKSVQAIRSRAALVRQGLGRSRAGLVWLLRRGAGVGAAGADAAIQKSRVVGRFLWQAARRGVRRTPSPAPVEPNLDTLFGRPPAPTIKTQVVDTSPPAASPSPVGQPTFHRQLKPKKKLTALQRAQQALQERNYQRAEDILVDHIVQHTKDTKAYMLLGRVATAKANWQEAVEIFEQVVMIQPHEPGAQAGLGIAAYNCGRYSRALQALQRAHEEDPTNLVLLNDLLAIAQKMDNPPLQRSIRSKLRELASAETSPNQVGQQS